MADIRPKDLATTATSPAADDYLLIDGTTEGTRKILGPLLAPRYLNLMAYGAIGDNSTDDRTAILAAIDAAYALGGATIVTNPGKVHRYSGRILLKPGVRIDIGRDSQFTAGATGNRLVATSADGGIDLVAGSHIRATLVTTVGSTYTGPMLDINDTKSTLLTFGTHHRQATFDVDIYLDRGMTNSTGIRFYSSTGDGVLFVVGRASVSEATVGVLMETATADVGHVNENWLEFQTFGCVEGLKGVNNGWEIAGNRIAMTNQTDSTARAQRALKWDGVRSIIDLFSWDWISGRIDLSAGGTQVELTAKSGGNIVNGVVSRGTGAPGGFAQMPVIDLGARLVNRNTVNLRSNRHDESVNLVTNGPAAGSEATFCGDQDDSFAFASRRYTVTTSGTTQPDATNVHRLFDPSHLLCAVSDCEDFTIQIDLGRVPDDNFMGMGVYFLNAPDQARIQGSVNATDWVTIIEAGYNSDIVPRSLFRVDSMGDYRYWRLICTNSAPTLTRLFRWWGVNRGYDGFGGAFASVYSPAFLGAPTVGGVPIVTTTDAQTLESKTLTAPGVTRGVLTDVNGTLSSASHSGRMLVTSGNVTVPTATGFMALIVAGGAHTVTFNGNTSPAMAAGDVMTVEVQSSTVIKAVLTAAAGLVSFT